MAARGAANDVRQGEHGVQGSQGLRARVWLGLTQLGAGQYHDAQQSLVAAQNAWQHDRLEADVAGDRLDAQLSDWIARSKGN